MRVEKAEPPLAFRYILSPQPHWLQMESARTRAMPITIAIPAALRECCAGASELLLSAPSVRAALKEIERSHAALYRSICDETGAVRRHVNLFVNTAHMRDREGLDTALVP